MNSAAVAPLPPARPMTGHGNALWVPSEAVACHLVTVPDVPRSKWQAMIPWLLEDQLLESPEALAFHFGQRDGDGRVPVLVTSRAQLTAWQQVGSGELVPDFFALPWRQGECALALSGGRALLRHGPWQGAAGPEELIWALLENRLGQTDERLVVYAEQGAAVLPPTLAARARVVDLALLFEHPHAPWLGMASGADQGRSDALPRAAWLTLSLAVLALLLVMVGIKVESGRMVAQANHLEGQLRLAYGEYFGADYDFAMADFQSVVSRQLEGGIESGESPLALVAELASVLPACGDCRIERLAVDSQALDLVLSGSADSVAALPLVGNGWHASLTADNEHWRYQLGGDTHE